MTMTRLKISKTLLAVMLTSAVATALPTQKTTRRLPMKAQGKKSIAL